ncbi:hypothetical protein HX799_03105 [Pseudomonas tolaasii]|nr:hypothetical protein [Pseudomonas tolaasii]
MEKSVVSSTSDACSQRRLTVDAEAVTAMQALIIVQDSLINLFTQRGSGYSASHSAKQPPEKSTSNTANSNPDWPADYTQYCTYFCTRQGAGRTTGRPACYTN